MERVPLPAYQHWQDLVRSEHYVLHLHVHICIILAYSNYSYISYFFHPVHVRILPFSHSCSTGSGGDSTHSSHCIMECCGHSKLLHRPLHCALQSSRVSASQETGWSNECSVSINCHVWCDCWSGLNSHLPVPSLCHCHSGWYTGVGGENQ